MRIRAGCLLLLFSIILLAPARLAAATIQTLEVTHSKDHYYVTFDVLLAAKRARAWELLSDYIQWPRLSKNLRESHLLKTFSDWRQRVRLRFRACVLFFCKSIHQTKDMSTHAGGDINTVMIPEESDFKAGWEHWQILADGNKTRVRYQAELIPAFRLPPLIGPWILKRKLRQTLIGTAKKLEALAAP